VKRNITQPCVVLGHADRAALVRDDLNRRGVRFVSCARSVGQVRRHLVLGEDTSLVLCVLLSVDDLTLTDRQHVARLLADRQCFPTRIFCVGIVGPCEEFTRWAPLGCDAYVADSHAAARMIREFAGASGVSTHAVTAQQLLRESTGCVADDDTIAAAPATRVSGPGMRGQSMRKPLRSTQARTVGSAGEPGRSHQPPT
jgi:hypothetical protein